MWLFFWGCPGEVPQQHPLDGGRGGAAGVHVYSGRDVRVLGVHVPLVYGAAAQNREVYVRIQQGRAGLVQWRHIATLVSVIGEFV